MKTMYETVVDYIGNWDCFLVLVNEDGHIERVVDDVTSKREHFSYKPISRGGGSVDSLVHYFREINKKNMYDGMPVFYLFSSTPCTGGRAWFISACEQNEIDNYELLSACWDINND